MFIIYYNKCFMINNNNNTRKNNTRNNNTRKNTRNNNTRKNNTRKNTRSICAPIKNKNKNKYIQQSCYSITDLLKIKNAWNKHYKQTKQIINSSNPIDIWKKLKYFTKNICKSERCWLKQEFAKHNLDITLLNKSFVPKRPEQWNHNPRDLINTNNIIDVMSQYEKAYPNFKFIGPSPIDFMEKKYIYKSKMCYHTIM